MSYTMSLLKQGFNFGVNSLPWGDKLFPNTDTQISKNEERRRLKTAKSMEKAIKKGQLKTVSLETVNQMELKAKKSLNEKSYDKNQYVYDQIKKVSSLTEALIPGSGVVCKGISNIGTFGNLKEYVKNSPSTKESVMKIGKTVVVPVVMGLSTPFIMPVVAPLLTVPVITGTVGTVISSVVGFDIYNYFRCSNSKSK